MIDKLRPGPHGFVDIPEIRAKIDELVHWANGVQRQMERRVVDPGSPKGQKTIRRLARERSR
jgi:hypothetical protein